MNQPTSSHPPPKPINHRIPQHLLHLHRWILREIQHPHQLLCLSQLVAHENSNLKPWRFLKLPLRHLLYCKQRQALLDGQVNALSRVFWVEKGVIEDPAAAELDDGFEIKHVTGVSETLVAGYGLASGSRAEDVNVAGGERAEGDDGEQLRAESGVCRVKFGGSMNKGGEGVEIWHAVKDFEFELYRQGFESCFRVAWFRVSTSDVCGL